MSARNIAFAVLGASALIVAAEIGITRALAPSQQTTALGAADPSIGGPFTLVDESGTPVTQAVLDGKPSVFYFGYTYCPEVCPTTLSDLTRWIGKLGPDADKLNYVFVTVDPQRDTPKVLHDYLGSFDKRIRGFTGTQAQIATIAKEYKVYFKRVPTKDGGYLMDHSAMLYLMTPQNQFRGVIGYQEADASAVAKLKELAGDKGS